MSKNRLKTGFGLWCHIWRKTSKVVCFNWAR